MTHILCLVRGFTFRVSKHVLYTYECDNTGKEAVLSLEHYYYFIAYH